MSIGLVAQPWWVNLLVLVPPFAWFSWRRGGVPVTARQLFISGLFAGAFGFLEAVVVVYLRAATGLLPGYQGTLSDVIRMSGQYYVQSQAITQFPKSLLSLVRHLGHYVLRGPLGHRTVAAFTQGSRRAVPHSRALAFAGVVSHPSERSRHGRRPRFPCHASKELIIKEKSCPPKRIPGALHPGLLISVPLGALFRIEWISSLLAVASQDLPPQLGCAG